MVRSFEYWIDRYRFIVICTGATVIPIFFLPFTPEDPFLIPKQSLLCLFAGVLGIVVLHPPERLLLPSRRSLLLSSLVFLISLGISIPGSTNYHSGLYELKRWIFLFVLFFSAIYIPWNSSRIRMLMILSMLVCCIVSVSALLEYFEIVPFYLYPFQTGRLYSFFGYQNIMAQYLSIMVLWGIGLTASSSTFRIRILFFIATLLSLSALLLTFCRGALVALGVCICLLCLHFYKIMKGKKVNTFLNREVWSMVLILFLLIFLGGSLFFVFTAFHDVKTTQLVMFALNRGDSNRFVIWKDTMHMFFNNPLRGVGLGNYPIVYPAYETGNSPWLILYAYNIFLHIVAETGIIGLCGFIIFSLTLFFYLHRQSALWDMSGNKMIFYFILYGCISTFIQSMVSYNFHSPTSAFFFFVSLGILCSSDRELTINRAIAFSKSRKNAVLVSCLIMPLIITGIIDEYKKIKGHYFYSQALLSLKGQDTVKGISYSAKALEYFPYNPDYHYLIAKKYRETGQIQLAFDHFLKAGELSPYIYKTSGITINDLR
jgi:O-antigen ligase